MALRIQPAPTFTVEASISVPGGEPERVRVTYKWMPRDAFAAFVEGVVNRRDEEVLGEIIVGIDGITDDTGAAVPYSADVLRRLLANYQTASLELYDTWVKEHQEAKRKN